MSRELTEAAQAAKMLRADLKAAFSAVKFSVKSSNFAGGDSIDVSWTDGPTAEQVRPHLWKYQAGTFDGMTDMYNYGPKKDHPTANYVHGQRSMSHESLGAVVAEINQRYGWELAIDDGAYFPQVLAATDEPSPWGNGYKSHEAYRAFQDRAF